MQSLQERCKPSIPQCGQSPAVLSARRAGAWYVPKERIHQIQCAANARQRRMRGRCKVFQGRPAARAGKVRFGFLRTQTQSPSCVVLNRCLAVGLDSENPCIDWAGRTTGRLGLGRSRPAALGFVYLCGRIARISEKSVKVCCEVMSASIKNRGTDKSARFYVRKRPAQAL